MDGEHRLFELTRGGRFTLLSFGVTPAIEAGDLRTLQVVGQPAGPGDVADTEGHLADAYGATEGTLVLIRPDGYVALISDAGDVSAVHGVPRGDQLGVLCGQPVGGTARRRRGLRFAPGEHQRERLR